MGWLFLPVIVVVFMWRYGCYVGFWGKSIEKPVKPGQIKIACVGDSITYGMSIKDRKHHCYPYMLQQLLGEKYNVRNYGLNNRNAMENGAMPYSKEKRFQQSLEFQPDIILLKLGTNDSKKDTWKGRDIWRKDYLKLIEYYRNLDCQPRIILLTPASPQPIRLKDGTIGTEFGIQAEAILEECAVIREIGTEMGFPVIDIHSLTENQTAWFNKDGIHPNAQGAKEIATYVYNCMLNV